MAITISGQNNNDKILASDGVLDSISGFNVVGVMTATQFDVTTKHTANHIDVGSTIQLGNAGIITATTLIGNVTGNVNSTSHLLLQISGSEKFRVGNGGQLGIGGANYGTSGQVLTSGGSGSAASWSTIASDKITEGNTEAEVVDTGSDGYFKVTTEGSERLRIDSSGDVLIGTTDDAIYGDSSGEGIVLRSGECIDINRTGDSMLNLNRLGSDGPIMNFRRDGSVKAALGTRSNAYCIDVNGSERLRIVSTGQVRIGNYNNLALWGQNNRLQVAGTDWSSSGITIACMGTSGSSNLVMGNSRGSTPGTALTSGDRLGYISFVGDDGTDMATVGAAIVAETDGNSSSNSVPGDLQFYTGGNQSANERLRITSDGKIGINQSSPQTRLHINQDWVASYGSISVEGGNNALVGLGLRSSGTYRAALIWRDGSSGDYLELATQSTSKPILFKPNNTERVRVQDGGLKLNGGSYIMEVTAGSGAPNNANRQMDQRRWMWYGSSSSTHTVARVAKAAGGQPGDGDSQIAAFIVTYTARTMYSFNSGGGYSVMKMRTGRFNYNNDTVHFSTEQDTMGTGSGSQNPTIVFTDEGSGVVRISITNPSSTHSFGEINVMTYDCRITLPTG